MINQKNKRFQPKFLNYLDKTFTDLLVLNCVNYVLIQDYYSKFLPFKKQTTIQV